MKDHVSFIRTTFIGGILFLVPLVVLAVIFEKALHLAHRVAAPLAEMVPVESVVGLRPVLVLAVALLLLFCFVAGVFARTALAQRFVAWLETTVLAEIPGYDFFKSLGAGLLGVESTDARPVVLVQLDDAWQLAFLAGRLDNGLMTVFVPDAPNPRTGAICYVQPENVTATALKPAQAIKLIRHLGKDSGALLGAVAVAGAKAASARKFTAPAMD